MSYRLDRLKEISPADRGRFEADGFLVVERLLEPEHTKACAADFRSCSPANSIPASTRTNGIGAKG
jgi:hypothetical protein